MDDPDNRSPIGYMYAPDVALGPDGRYYLYYFYTSRTAEHKIKVAVCDTPAGHYTYYGEIKTEKEKQFIPFDPAIFVDEDERVWLYYGSAFQMGGSIFKALGGAVIELDRDMLTPISAPKLTVPNIFHQKGTTFKGHAFFEASSMRKIKGKYYFIYSSMLSNEFCYAISERPDGPFTYGGIIVSNGDVGLNGNKLAVYPTGNNHGSVECINGKWYVFYHRHTQGSAFSRQGCAEPIEIEADSRIRQVAITSCGLNGVALSADGEYPAGICCYLTDTKKWKKVKPACVDEEYEMGSPVSFVSNLKSDSVVGYKYFELNKSKQLTLYVRLSLAEVSMMKSLATNQCRAEGRIEIYSSVDREPIAKKNLVLYAGDWETVLVDLPVIGNTALYIKFVGNGAIDLKSIKFEDK